MPASPCARRPPIDRFALFVEEAKISICDPGRLTQISGGIFLFDPELARRDECSFVPFSRITVVKCMRERPDTSLLGGRLAENILPKLLPPLKCRLVGDYLEIAEPEAESLITLNMPLGTTREKLGSWCLLAHGERGKSLDAQLDSGGRLYGAGHPCRAD